MEAPGAGAGAGLGAAGLVPAASRSAGKANATLLVALGFVAAAGVGAGAAFLASRGRTGGPPGADTAGNEPGGNGGGVGGTPSDRRASSSGPTIDAAVEARAAAGMRALLRARRGRDGGYASRYDQPADGWTTAQALSAIVASEEQPESEVGRELVAHVRASALDRAPPEGGPAVFAGWPYRLGDDAACIEATAWPGIALALARRRIPDLGIDVAEDGRRVARFLIRTQTADGAFPSVAGLTAEEDVRASATSLALLALVCLGAVEPAETRDPATLSAAARAAGWLVRRYDRARHVWFPNPVGRWGLARTPEGLSEHIAFTLLEARELLRRLPPETTAGIEAGLLEALDATLRDYAESAPSPASVSAGPAEAPVRLTHVGVADIEDYVFDFPPDVRSSIQAIRWVWYPWRLLVAERIAATPDLPRREAWTAEAARLRAQLPDLAKALPDVDTFQIAESVLAVGLVRSQAYPAGAPRPSLVSLLTPP